MRLSLKTYRVAFPVIKSYMEHRGNTLPMMDAVNNASIMTGIPVAVAALYIYEMTGKEEAKKIADSVIAFYKYDEITDD